MGDAASSTALLRLMSWLSPAFPVGAFAYSHGLERAIHDGVLHDRETLSAWLGDLIRFGSSWNDAVLLAEAWRKAEMQADWHEVAELAEAMAGSRERHMETTLQGRAFLEAVGVWAQLPPHPASASLGHPLPVGERTSSAPALQSSAIQADTSTTPSPHRGEGGRAKRRPGEGALSQTPSYPYPISVGITAARHGVPLEDTLVAYLHAFTSNLIQAAVRLVPLGQRDGVAVLAELEPAVLETARRAAASTLDDLGSGTFMSDIMSMKHETQYSRVFRS